MANKIDEIVQFLKDSKPECRSIKWEIFENGILILQETPSLENINDAISKVLKPPKHAKQNLNLNTAFYNIKHEPVYCFKANIDTYSKVFLCSQYYTEGVCMENSEVSFKIHSVKSPLIFYISKPDCNDQIDEFFRSRFDKNDPFLNILCRYKSFLSFFNVHEISDQIVIKAGTFFIYIASGYCLYTKSHQPKEEIPHSPTVILSPVKQTSPRNLSTKNKVSFQVPKTSKLIVLEEPTVSTVVTTSEHKISPSKDTYPVMCMVANVVEYEAEDKCDTDEELNTLCSDWNHKQTCASKSKTRKVKNPYIEYSEYCKVLNENKVLKAKLKNNTMKLSRMLKQQLKRKNT